MLSVPFEDVCICQKDLFIERKGGVHEFPVVHFAFLVIGTHIQKSPIQPASTPIPACIQRFGDLSTTRPRYVIDELPASLLLQKNGAALLKLLRWPGLHNVGDANSPPAFASSVIRCSTWFSLGITAIITFTFIIGIIIGTSAFA
jgi:hypothetical protein